MTKLTRHRPALLRNPVTALLTLILLLSGAGLRAAPLDLHGAWYQAPEPTWVYQGQADLAAAGLIPVHGVTLTGGSFYYQGELEVSAPGRYVLDFKNTSVIGEFHHYLYDARLRPHATLTGGLQSPAENPYFLRHGREVELTPGRYRLISVLSSPYYLAQPEPYLDTLGDYQVATRAGNAVVLLGLGVFLGLGIYYTALALVRRRLAEAMYALFILGNTLFNASSHMVLKDLFGVDWFYLSSVPILLSNGAYIVFVLALLEIERGRHPVLYRIGLSLLTLLGAFVLLAALYPHASLELARYGVGVFLLFGLTAGVTRALQGNTSARLYLIAIAAFFVLGGVAITQMELVGVYTLHMEHVGLLAVAVEVVLLALVLAYQFAQLHRDKEHMRLHLERSDRMVRTDGLTGLSNRLGLDTALAGLTDGGSLTFIDLDRLKYYNDHYGHERGDELLQTFARQMSSRLGQQAQIFRVGGDEFAIVCPSGEVARVEALMAEAIAAMHGAGFDFAGASAGSAHRFETATLSDLKHLADVRMYMNKHEGRPHQRPLAS